MSYQYEYAMGTADAQATAIFMEDVPAGEEGRRAEIAAIERREEAYRARVAQMTDDQLAQENGQLNRESWIAECDGTRFDRWRERSIALREYTEREAQRSMPEIPLPTGVPCFDERESRREFEQTIDDIFPSVPLVLEPIKGYIKTARFVLVPGAKLNAPIFGESKVKTAALLAIPPAVGYWTYKKKDDNPWWGVGAALGTLYGASIAGTVLFYAAMAGVRY